MKHLFLTCVAVLFVVLLAAQDGFVIYNKNRLNPYMVGKHQLLFGLNYTTDVKVGDREYGNLAPGHNIGLGAGYNYRVMMDNQSVALGARVEWYPDRLYKFNLNLDFDHGIYAYKGFQASVLMAGIETNISLTEDLKEWETHFIWYLAEVKYKEWELKWGMQMWWEVFKPTEFIDHSLSVFKLTREVDL